VSPAERAKLRSFYTYQSSADARTICALLDALDAAERDVAFNIETRQAVEQALADSRELGTYHLKQIAELRMALADRTIELRGLAISPPLDVDP
jgi:hypothetical protein